MKKFFRTGLLALALMILLAIPAFAVSSVDQSSGTSNWTYTATLDDPSIAKDQMFLLIVIKTSSLSDTGGFPATLSAGDILYIDQKTASAEDQTNHTIVFSNFIPMNYVGGKAFITGDNLSGPTYLGDLPSHGILGDANGDEYVDIADMTAIRDHILKRTTLTGTKLAMADVNNDTHIDVADITKVRDFILKRIPSLT